MVGNVERSLTSPPFDSTNGRQCRVWHDIIVVGQHAPSNDVERGMTSLPLDITQGQTTWVWHAIIAFGKHTRSNDIRRGMPSSPVGSTHGRTTSGVACHHHLWATQTVERRRAWHEITALGLHRRSNDVGCGMTSLSLDRTHGQTTSGVA